MAIATKYKEAGFTLVEVLCVLALLGLTAGLVVLNLPKPAAPFRTEAMSIAGVLNLAARESIIDGKIRGIDFTSSELEVLKYDGEWMSEGRREFTEVYEVRLTVEQQDIDLADRRKKKEKSELALSPLIVFDATGSITPFTVSLKGADKSYILEPDVRGRIIMEGAR